MFEIKKSENKRILILILSQIQTDLIYDEMNRILETVI